MEEKIIQLISNLVTVGGGVWIVTWLKEVIKDTFKKIDDMNSRLTKLEHWHEFEEKQKKL